MNRQDYITDEQVVKRVNAAVKIELEKTWQWVYQLQSMIENRKRYIK